MAPRKGVRTTASAYGSGGRAPRPRMRGVMQAGGSRRAGRPRSPPAGSGAPPPDLRRWPCAVALGSCPEHAEWGAPLQGGLASCRTEALAPVSIQPSALARPHGRQGAAAPHEFPVLLARAVLDKQLALLAPGRPPAGEVVLLLHTLAHPSLLPLLVLSNRTGPDPGYQNFPAHLYEPAPLGGPQQNQRGPHSNCWRVHSGSGMMCPT